MEASGICTMTTPSAKRLQQSIQGSAAHSYFDSDRLLHSQTERLATFARLIGRMRIAITLLIEPTQHCSAVQAQLGIKVKKGQEMSVLSPH